MRPNQLTGYGIVVGLAGTGDDSIEYATQGMKGVVSRFGLTLPQGEVLLTVGGKECSDHAQAIKLLDDLSELGANYYHYNCYYYYFSSNQRRYILLRNSRGFGRQVILDVAVTGIDGQSRTSDDAPDRPLNVRYEQKMTKYHRVANENGF